MANCLRVIEYRMQFLPNFTEFACGAPLPLGNLRKSLKQLLVLLQKVIGLPFKGLGYEINISLQAYKIRSVLSVYARIPLHF